METPKVLLVEDHEDTRELMIIALGQSDYEVSTAGSIAEALMLVAKQHFDLFVLDSVLPDGTGLELCKSIRQADQSTPILFCSGVADEKDKSEALISGAQRYLIKPVDLPLLYSALAELVSIRQKGSGNATA
jgi:DNA-binding response OmpR family regulator